MVKCFQKYHLTLLQLTTIEKVHFIITRKASFENVRQDLSATLIEDKVDNSYSIVIRNGKIVWKGVWIECYLRLNMSSRRYSFPGCLSIHQMLTLNVPGSQNSQNSLNNCIRYIRPAFWSTDISKFYYSDINLFLIDDAGCKICNIWLLLFESNSRTITILDLNTGGKYWCSYYSR